MSWLEDLLTLIHPADQAGFRQAFIATVKGIEQDFSVDFRMRHKSGAWQWLHARGRVTERAPETDGAPGRATHMSGTLADVDSRKRAEHALHATELRFEDVAGVSREYVWETDAEWRYTYLSERVEADACSPRGTLRAPTPRHVFPPGPRAAVRP